MSKLATILLSGFALTIVTPSWATPIIFAQYDQIGSGAGFTLDSQRSDNANDYTVTIKSHGLVGFTYLIGGTPFGSGGSREIATLDFTATTTVSGNCSGSACTAGYTESGYSGSFTITRNAPLNDLSLLLKGTFGPAGTLSSFANTSTGTLQATSSNPNQMTFTSDFLKFTDSVTRSATFSLSQLFPLFSVISTTGTSKFYPTGFTALGSGFFAEELAAPEPSTFALLAGALLGLCLWQRRRRQLHR